MKNTLYLKYDGIDIRTVSAGYGFILTAVIIVAKNKEDKQKRMSEYLAAKHLIELDIAKLGWQTVRDTTPKVFILTQSYLKKKKYFY